MIQSTKGIVLRTVKFGETSLIVTVFTELFGLQSYLVNGVRTSSAKGSSKAGFFQPAAILELVAYHNEFKNLQRLKEFKWGFLYQQIFSTIPKNAVALFMVELLTKCLKQPEANAELFYFTEDSFCRLDKASAVVTANFSLFFAIHLAFFLGFRISDEYAQNRPYLDLREGRFVAQTPVHSYFLQDREAIAVSDIIKIRQPEELEQIALNQESRRKIVQALESFYMLHIPDFGTLRSLPVLREVMNSL